MFKYVLLIICERTNRTSSHQRPPKKVTPWREQLRQEGNQEAASESCSGDREPPPSPIHSALGQVCEWGKLHFVFVAGTKSFLFYALFVVQHHAGTLCSQKDSVCLFGLKVFPAVWNMVTCQRNSKICVWCVVYENTALHERL